MKRRDILLAAGFTPMLLRGQNDRPPKATLAEEQGMALLRRMQTALGGTERLTAVRDVDWIALGKTWKASGEPGPDATRRIRWIHPNILRKDQHVGDVTVSHFFDGEGGWELVPDAGLIDLKGRELEFVRGEAGGFYPQKWLPDRDPGLRVVAVGPDTIRITKKGVERGKDIVVDPKSGLPLRTLGTPLSGKPTTAYGRVGQRLEFVEWQTVDGIKWPRKLRNFHDGAMLVELTTSAITINSGFDLVELSRKPRG